MYCMIVIGSLLGIWTTVILYVFRRWDRRAAQIECIEAVAKDSENGSIGAIEQHTIGEK